MPGGKQSEIRSYFQIEARELVDALTEEASQLGDQAPTPAQVQRLARAAHTLKGAAHVVNEPEVARLAHEFEDVLAAHREAPATGSAARLLALADAMSAAISQNADPAVPDPGPPAPDPGRAAQEVAGTPAFAPPPLPLQQTPRAVDGDAETQIASSPEHRTVRVELHQTENLLTHIAESTRLAAGMRKLLDGFSAGQQGKRAPAEADTLVDAMSDQLDRLDRETAELYRVGSQLRLISSERLLLEAGRVVRATAASAGKQVHAQIHGSHERIDVHVLEALEGALLHLVRNAIAHGIESPAERRELGKLPVATVTVELTRRGNEVRLVCADDGRGIDVEQIRAAAQSQGILRPGDALAAGRDALFAFLFRPGFSTAARADQISGRGIGLDAIRATATSLGGTVSISSELGKGTRFTLAVPQTLVAIRALEVASGGTTFALPFSAVEQTFLLGAHHTGVALGEQGSSTLFDGKDVMPFLRLRDALPDVHDAQAVGRREFAHDSVAQTPRATCVVLRSQTSRLALEVDAVGQISELLVRPLSPFLGALPFIGGASVLASGEPMLVLEPDGLAAFAESPIRQHALPVSERKQPSAGPILVIDDSLTTRTLEQSILETAGYSVEVATSAEQALSMAAAQTYSLFLVDVEMPGMNGFEFVRTVQADPNLRKTPSIMVTSLDSAETREQGRAAGAETYIVKGEFNQKVYLDRIQALIGPATDQRSPGLRLGSAR